MKLLITGFSPFGGETINPAWEAVKKVKDEINGVSIIKLEIPTVFNKSLDVLRKEIDKIKPDIVLCIGQAGGTKGISIERVAINLDDAIISDNEGNTPIDEKVFEDGQNAYFSNLPVKAMMQEIKKLNIPVNISYSAGTFVCNHLMYGLLYFIEKEYKDLKAGFIHVPYIPEQVVGNEKIPSLKLEDIVKAIEAAILAVTQNENDINMSAGRIY